MELETIRWRDDRVKVICPLASGKEEKNEDKEEPDRLMSTSLCCACILVCILVLNIGKEVGIKEQRRGGEPLLERQCKHSNLSNKNNFFSNILTNIC